MPGQRGLVAGQRAGQHRADAATDPVRADRRLLPPLVPARGAAARRPAGDARRRGRRGPHRHRRLQRRQRGAGVRGRLGPVRRARVQRQRRRPVEPAPRPRSRPRARGDRQAPDRERPVALRRAPDRPLRRALLGAACASWPSTRVDLAWAELALRFSAYAPGVHTAIVGTATLANLAANVAAAGQGPLPADVLARPSTRPGGGSARTGRARPERPRPSGGGARCHADQATAPPTTASGSGTSPRNSQPMAIATGGTAYVVTDSRPASLRPRAYAQVEKAIAVGTTPEVDDGPPDPRGCGRELGDELGPRRAGRRCTPTVQAAQVTSRPDSRRSTTFCATSADGVDDGAHEHEQHPEPGRSPQADARRPAGRHPDQQRAEQGDRGPHDERRREALVQQGARPGRDEHGCELDDHRRGPGVDVALARVQRDVVDGEPRQPDEDEQPPFPPGQRTQLRPAGRPPPRRRTDVITVSATVATSSRPRVSAPGLSQGAANRMTTNADAQASTVTTTATTPARPRPSVSASPAPATPTRIAGRR